MVLTPEQLQGKVRVPVEAAQLQQALQDAESGKAQREKGDDLDQVVPEGTGDLQLAEGEVLKLPPTPDMTDGHEHESDPETERLHTEHSHGAAKLYTPPHGQTQLPEAASGSSSPSTRPVPQVPSLPPALPARRPPLTEAVSAESVYSDDSPAPQPLGASKALEAARDAEPAGQAPPPPYASAATGTAPQDQLWADGPEETEMTEAERREWAEYHAAQDAQGIEQGVRGLQVNEAVQSHSAR